MQILTTTVDQRTFGKQRSNGARIGQALKLLDAAKGRKHLLVVLPAGYLRAPLDADESSVAAVADPLVEHAKDIGAGIVVGVDASPPPESTKSTGRRGLLPYWVVAWAPGLTQPFVWRQRSVVGAAKAGKQEPISAEGRLLKIGSKQVEVVICGEGFNPTLQSAIKARAMRLSAVVIPAHRAHGSRHWQAQRFFSAELSLPAPRSVHAIGSASNNTALPAGSAVTVDEDFPFTPGAPWIRSTVYAP